MTLEQKVTDQAALLRKCAGHGNCVGCPLFAYVGNCNEKIKRDSAELLEDQQAVIQALMTNISDMIESIIQLQDKYSGGEHGKEAAGC